VADYLPKKTKRPGDSPGLFTFRTAGQLPSGDFSVATFDRKQLSLSG